jgi:uncharacterized protein with HEPN domain
MFSYDKAILSLLIEAIEKIEKYSFPFSSSHDFVTDTKSFDATLMNFVVLAECIGRLSEYFKNLHPEIEWRKIAAFRNIIAHDYFGIDEDEVWDIVQYHIPKLKLQLENINTNETLG